MNDTVKMLVTVGIGFCMMFGGLGALYSNEAIGKKPPNLTAQESGYEYTQDDLNWMVEECDRMGNAVVLTKVNYNDKPTVLPLCVDLETWIGRK